MHRTQDMKETLIDFTVGFITGIFFTIAVVLVSSHVFGFNILVIK